MEPNSIMNDLWASIQAPVLLLLTTVITAAAGWLAVKVNTFFNVTNEAQARANEVVIRNVLHEAVWSAAKYALQKTGLKIEDLKTGMPSKEFTQIAIDYIRTKNPDTAAAAGLTPTPKGDDALSEIITSKIPDLVKMLMESKPAPAKPAARK
jgi:hypothetical protein